MASGVVPPTGRQTQSASDIGSLLTEYRVERDDIDRLVALTERADEAAWWMGAAGSVPEWFRTFAGLERIATREFVYEPTIINGLLQTQAYAREVSSASMLVSRADIERVVALRLARAERLIAAEEPLQLHAILAEAALHLRVGDDQLRHEQLVYLTEMAQRPNITLQVIRPEDGYHSAHQGRFTLLDFAEVRSFGYMEMIDGAVYLQDPNQVRTCGLIADQLSHTALGPDESVELVLSLAAEISG
jgi:hypothetical protein